MILNIDWTEESPSPSCIYPLLSFSLPTYSLKENEVRGISCSPCDISILDKSDSLLSAVSGMGKTRFYFLIFSFLISEKQKNNLDTA